MTGYLGGHNTRFIYVMKKNALRNVPIQQYLIYANKSFCCMVIR